MDSNQTNFTPNQTPNPAPANNGKGFSVAALVLGIVGVAGSFISAFGIIGYIIFACAILGIVFGVKGRNMSVAAEGKASGLATAGLVLGIIGVCFSAGGLICNICATAACGSIATGIATAM